MVQSAKWETWVRSLGWEDALEKGTTTHCSILACRIPWIVYPWGHKELDTTERLSLPLALQADYLLSEPPGKSNINTIQVEMNTGERYWISVN